MGNRYPEREYFDLPEETSFYSEYGAATRANRVWAGHRFTDAEVEALARGEVITFTLTRDNGRTETVMGKLEGKTFSPKDEPDRVVPYVGFTPMVNPETHVQGVWAATGKSVKFKRKFGDHHFTDEEVAILLRGETIGFSGVNSKGEYNAIGKLARKTFTPADEPHRVVNYIGVDVEFVDAD